MDHARVGGRDLLVAEAEPLERPWLEVGDDDVGAFAQSPGQRAVALVGEVERDRALVAVGGVVVGGAAGGIAGRAPGAGVVAGGGLDLDDVGAEVAQRLADGAIRGVELETATLLSRLPDIFASLRDPATWLALRNGEGGVLVQSGGAAEAPGPIGIVVPLAPELPHWEIVCSRLDAHSARRPMLLAAWLLLSLVLAALVSGGLLLARDAAMQRRDALQKTSFVSSVSHELKTPLTSIRLYAELLRDGRVSEAPKQGQYLNVIVAESERLTRLVNNVLDFSRMEQALESLGDEKIQTLVALMYQLSDALERANLADADATPPPKSPERS